MNHLVAMNKLFSTVFALAFCFFLSRCSTEGVVPGGQPVEVSQQIAARTTDFSFDFFKKVQATQPAQDNLFVSPLSLHMALGMLLNGAEGETAQQITRTLNMDDVSQNELNLAYKALLEGLPKADPMVELGLANSVWYRNTFQVENNFLNVLRQSFGAEVAGLNFNDPSAKDKINGWASSQTNGKIPKVIDEIRPEHVLFLMNALYFKGDWKYKFNPESTSDAPFQLADDREKMVKMMSLKENFKVAHQANYSAIELPYANGQFNLTLLIPDQGTSPNQVIDGLSATAWNELRTSLLKEANVRVGLPRFTLQYEIKLNDALVAMGMPRAFTDAAELGKINSTVPLTVNLVKQNTYLGIDEKGTEAAAVTTIGVGVTSVGPDPYVCNRPFVLLISENTSNTILFMGRIMNP